MTDTATLNVADAFRTLTITISVPRTLRLRLWLGTHLMRLGAWIIGCGFRVVEDDQP